MTIFNMLMVALAMTAITIVWFGIHYYLNPRMENQDGIAKVTGSCGDTMEIALKFNGPRVEDVNCWTDGCAISKMCVETVGMLARGKTVQELRAIDTAAILERVGNLPDTHMHCAVLAETTLQKAVTFYKHKSTDYKHKSTDLESCGTEYLEEHTLDDGRNHQAVTSLMEEPKYVVYLFPSFNYVMKAEKILNEIGIAHKIIPVPRHISSDCGVCLRITEDQQKVVNETLREKVAWEHVATL